MERLFVYGSLQPGGPNETVLGDIGGEWAPATVRGRLVNGGWGAEIGFPGLVLDDDGGIVSGYVFSSAALAEHWESLDRFEGDEYLRVTSEITFENGDSAEASIYVLRSEASGR